MVGPRESLGLLALLTSAVVTTSGVNDYFSLWDSMIGLIIVTIAAAYRDELGVDKAYRAAFSLIVGAGLMFIVGPFVESLLYFVKPTIRYEGPFLQTPDKMLYDGVFVGLWIAFALAVYAFVKRRPTN